MLLWATIVSLLAAVGVQAQERVVDLTPKRESDDRTASQSNWREQVDCRGRSTDRIGPAPTLSLAVARLDRSEFSMGGSDLEGIVAKWAHGAYQDDGRATSWLKIKNPDFSQAEGRHELLESRRRPALPSRRVKALPPALALRAPRKKY